MTNIQKELIAIEVIRTLYAQFDKFPEGETNNRNAPFHEAFLNAFSEKLEGKVSSIPVFISLASWMHGLNTSLGQSFLEKTAHILCNGVKRGFTTKKKTALQISGNQKEIINRIITDLTNGNRNPNLLQEDNECFPTQNFELDTTDFTVDVFFEDDEQIVCIELKTVKPNKGIFKVEKEKVLEAKAALRNIYQNKTVKYYLGFPFDPLSETSIGYNKQRYMDYSVGFRKYFAEDEFLLSAELWDFLSGETQTMESIIEIINAIATVDFEEKFIFLQNSRNRSNRDEYLSKLKNWYLLREKTLIENQDKVLNKIKNNKNLIKIFNQNIFDNLRDCNDRYLKLQEIFIS
jgi:hypothetical protein